MCTIRKNVLTLFVPAFAVLFMTQSVQAANTWHVKAANYGQSGLDGRRMSYPSPVRRAPPNCCPPIVSSARHFHSDDGRWPAEIMR